MFSQGEHLKYDYEEYGYTQVGANSGKSPDGSLEIGFNRAAQADYLYARFANALSLAQKSPATLLDADCGPSAFLSTARRHQPGIDMLSLDPSAGNVTEPERIDQVTVRHGFWVDRMSERFDAITLFGNLMLHENPRQVSSWHMSGSIQAACC